MPFKVTELPEARVFVAQKGAVFRMAILTDAAASGCISG